jgi:dolichyl-diphosphooligosaccharide--protein glycosyltransferase
MECTLRTCLLLHGKLQNFVFLNTNANLLVFFWSKVSSWGGYVFLINLIPLHVLTLILTGRFSHRVYVAYSAVYTLGTLLSMQVAFVGFQPVQSSEHMLVRLGIAKALHF